MKHYFVLLLLMCFSISAHSETHLILHGVAYHGDRSQDWQETNPGLSIEYNSWRAGSYLNSYDRNTTYAGYAWRPLDIGYVKVGLLAGIATGYPSTVLVLPSITIGGSIADVEIVGAPALGKGTTWFMGASLRIKM